MGLHRLSSITIGVPNVDETRSYYAEFGLEETEPGRFATVDGGNQLTISHAPTRRPLAIVVGADDFDDIERISGRLTALGVPVTRSLEALHATEPVTGVEVTVAVEARRLSPQVAGPVYNGPGHTPRLNARAEAILRRDDVRPRKLGHIVIGSVDKELSQKFFVEGLGFKISDNVTGRAAFMRCSTDHHNVLVQQAPINFLHHTAWEVDDVDEVGRGATAMLSEHPERHAWGLGRHHIGSNFFWYLKDPAGNFSEYYSDLDCIVDDALWTSEDFQGARTRYNWGAPPPQSFIMPEDIAAAMVNAH